MPVLLGQDFVKWEVQVRSRDLRGKEGFFFFFFFFCGVYTSGGRLFFFFFFLLVRMGEGDGLRI